MNIKNTYELLLKLRRINTNLHVDVYENITTKKCILKI